MIARFQSLQHPSPLLPAEQNPAHSGAVFGLFAQQQGHPQGSLGFACVEQASIVVSAVLKSGIDASVMRVSVVSAMLESEAEVSAARVSEVVVSVVSAS